jgi:hypothetical protein
MSHKPALQSGDPFEGVGHSNPHPLQLSLLLLKSRQVLPPHRANPERQISNLQFPFSHLDEALGKLQVLLQLPQFSAVFKGRQEVPPHRPNPLLHSSKTQIPFSHFAEALLKLQIFPIVPQLFLSSLVLISQPSLGLLFRSTKFSLQDPTPQTPAIQAGVPLVTGGQAAPLGPQWFTSVLVLVSQPLVLSPSKFPKPGRQEPIPQSYLF